MRLRHLLPALLAASLAAAGPLLPGGGGGAECPAGSDGPQFRCWLEQSGQLLPR